MFNVCWYFQGKFLFNCCSPEDLFNCRQLHSLPLDIDIGNQLNNTTTNNTVLWWWWYGWNKYKYKYKLTLTINWITPSPTTLDFGDGDRNTNTIWTQIQIQIQIDIGNQLNNTITNNTVPWWSWYGWNRQIQIKTQIQKRTQILWLLKII